MPDSYVLDSLALLAYLRKETGGPKVEELLRRAETGEARLLLCIINYGEVLYMTERRHDSETAKDVAIILDNLPIEIFNADRRLAFSAAHIRAHYRLSYADAFAVALAQRESAALVTGDPEFASVLNLVQLVNLL